MSNADRFFYANSGKSEWHAYRADQRQQVIEDKKPRYVTVLDLSQLVDETTPQEDLRRVRYSGPMYFDWDCEDLMEGAQSVRDLLKVLEIDYEVDTRCVRLYATGGRGYHAEIPFEVFCQTEQLIAGGVPLLPLVYKEMWYELYTQDADGAIYSTKRGRMWRTANVEREEAGRYKVPITREHLDAMTPELYLELTSAPQVVPVYPAPRLSPRLAAKFDDYRRKVEEKARLNAKRKDNSAEAVKGFRGEWPASALRVMSGEGLNPDVGLNKIALQLGVLSVALGKSIDDHIKACKGLIDSYKGDGHSTKRQVRNELRRMYAYAESNPSYTYSTGAFRSIILADDPEETADLQPEANQSASRAKGNLGDLAGGISIGSNGIYLRKEGIARRETNWHFNAESAKEMRDSATNDLLGYEFDSLDGGQFIKHDFVHVSTLTATEKMRLFLAERGAVAPRLDTTKLGGIYAQVVQAATRNGVVHTISKEGLSLVNVPGSEPQMIWATADHCQMYRSSEQRYTFRPSMGSERGNFESDLMSAPELSSFDQEEVLEVLDALLNYSNHDYSIAAPVGWLVSCFLQPYHVKLNQSFPLLEVYGESGGGKTTTIKALLHMFYHENTPKSTTCGSGTPFGRRVMMVSSESIPYFFDEYKPHQMTQDQTKEMQALIHAAYMPSMQEPRGAGNGQGRLNGWTELSQETRSAPVIISTETPQSETATQERMLAVPFSKIYRRGRDAQIATLKGAQKILAALGRACATGAMAYGLQRARELIREAHAEVRPLEDDGNTRVVYNYGVAVAGLQFFGRVLRKTLGDEAYEARVRDRLLQLIEVLRTPEQLPMQKAAPEITKMLQYMIAVTQMSEHDQELACQPGKDYAYPEKGSGDVDLDVDIFYIRYRAALQRRGGRAVFADVDQFWTAIRSSSILVETQPADSPLITAGSPGVIRRLVRLNGAKLAEAGVGMFHKTAV